MEEAPTSSWAFVLAAMARQHRRKQSKSDFRLLLKRLALIFWSDAEDDDDDLLGLLFLVLAKKHISAGSRGPYDRVKSVDFCQKLLYDYTDRWFKAHMR